MTNKTEDKFYFRRATDSEIENLLLEAQSLMDDGQVSKAIHWLRKASNSIDTNTSSRLKKILSDMMREANVRFARPGEPERFGGFDGLGDWKIDFRNLMKERVGQLKQLAKTLKASVKLDRISPNGYYSGSVIRRYGAMEPPDLSAPGKVTALIKSLGGYIEPPSFSRPGQPERFAARDHADIARALDNMIVKALENNLANIPAVVNARRVRKNLSATFGEKARAWSDLKRELQNRSLMSRPGQPEQFAVGDDRANDFLRRMAVGINANNMRQMQILVSQALAYGQNTRNQHLIEEAKAAHSEILDLKRAGY